MFRRFSSLALTLVLLNIAAVAYGQQTKSAAVVSAFKEVVAKPRESTVRVQVGGKDVALGTVVSADGWIITKHSTVKGDTVTCKFAGGKELEGKVVGFDPHYDLSLVKVDAEDLKPIDWAENSKASKIGHWV